jgi:phosphohistidine swiveling domain-containing protein
MSVAVQTQLQRIPARGDFPVTFAPGEEHLLWAWDRSHFPGQLTPFEADAFKTIAEGMNHAVRRYAIPLTGYRTRVDHGYGYLTTVPPAAGAEEMGDLVACAEQELMAAMGQLGALWRDTWLPEIRHHLAATQHSDLAEARLDELIAKLDDAEQRIARLWGLHFEVIYPSYLAISEFEELAKELLSIDSLEAYKMLQGLPNKTVEAGHDLWRLSRVALASPVVTRVLETEAAADVRRRLAQSEAGRDFLAHLDGHLQRFGHRGQTWGLHSPSFIEDPTPVIKNLKDFIGQPDSADPIREQARQAAEREAMVASAREQLAGYPTVVREQVEAMLVAGQDGLVLSEDHGFYIDFWSTDNLRQILMAIGRWLAAAGVLETAGDVLYLTSEEIRTIVRASSPDDPADIVGRRKAELALYASVTPPEQMGSLPPGPPPESAISRLWGKFYGGPPAHEDGVIHGTAGSSGKVVATARVIRSLADAERLSPGEVLVTEMTAPPWTPLFASAAAIVTDTGGVLSHSAVVAREYALPAVVGTGTATSIIRDGDRIEVDGDAGIVRIL